MRIRKRLVVVSTTALLALGYGVAGTGLASAGRDTATRPPGCTEAVDGQAPPTPTPTTVTAVGQAYYCIFDHYWAGPKLDSRTLLVPAFAALTEELQRRGIDQSTATMPPLTGKKDADWAAFAKAYQQVIDKSPDDATVRQALAKVTVRGMVDALNDNHVSWAHAGGDRPAPYNFEVSGLRIGNGVDPVATAPLFVTSVAARSPADVAELKAGDEVVAVNDIPPYVNGVLSLGVLGLITNNLTGDPIKLTVHRPSTGATLTITVPSGPPPRPDMADGARVVKDGVGYVKVGAFSVDMVDQVLASIAALRAQTTLQEIIIDVRGNGGGDPDALSKLISSFVHGKTYGYWCDAHDRCTAAHTDDSVDLLNLKLVALTDRRCSSACDAFADVVKDLHLGTLIGTRTAGVVSGPAAEFNLSEDGSLMSLPTYYGLGANKQYINTIGIAPDYYVPLTADDLSNGRDPAVDKAAGL
jgi:carboxyl-terminal processing protease